MASAGWLALAGRGSDHTGRRCRWLSRSLWQMRLLTLLTRMSRRAATARGPAPRGALPRGRPAHPPRRGMRPRVHRGQTARRYGVRAVATATGHSAVAAGNVRAFAL